MSTIRNKIKLVIWDLDETFWKGTLSEEGITYSDVNHDIVIQLARRGIVSSICSKNDFEQVKLELINRGIWEYFVFPEIDWCSKGAKVQAIISDMGLRAENVLFIDDNLGNLNEVKHFNPSISVAEPSIIDSLLFSKELEGKLDPELTRLKQYRLLEAKREAINEAEISNEEFLQSSEIKVSVHYDVLNQIDRVCELVERTNQLNYTKKRSSKSTLIGEIEDPSTTECAYIYVEDKFGSYGISGFYLCQSTELVHFLFSCRSMNMGIESWLYKHLGQPSLEINGEVALQLNPDKDYSYIQVVDKLEVPCRQKSSPAASGNILFMGGCDLDQVVHYLSSRTIATDFNYVNSLGINVHKEHTSLIRQLCLSEECYDEVLAQVPILDLADKDYKLINNHWDYLIYSPLNDYSRGIYQHNETGFLLPFDAFNINWADKANWGNIPSHLKNIPQDFFEDLYKNYTFCGAITPSQFKSNLEAVADRFPERRIFILNGSEKKLSNTKYWEDNMEVRHQEMNVALSELGHLKNVAFIDVNALITSESDHLDNIRHYKKHVYSKIASEIVTLLEQGGAANAMVLRNEFLVNMENFFNRLLQLVRRIFAKCL